MVELIGFDSNPMAIVEWLENGEGRFKTVCYSDEDIVHAVNRAENKRDFHYGMDYRIFLVNSDERIGVLGKEERKVV